MPNNKETNLLTIKEVAAYLRMGVLTTYKLIKEGKIPAFKIGRQWRVKKEDLEKYIDERKIEIRKVKPKKKEDEEMKQKEIFKNEEGEVKDDG